MTVSLESKCLTQKKTHVLRVIKVNCYVTDDLFCEANVSVFCLADILRTRRQKKTDWGHQVEVIRKPKQIKVAFFFSFQFYTRKIEQSVLAEFS